MSIFLKSLSLQYYRGIGPDIQYMKGFSDLNFFIGANNAGKSIILNFIATYLPLSGEPSFREIDLNSVESYRGKSTGTTKAAIGRGCVKTFHFQQNCFASLSLKRFLKLCSIRELKNSMKLEADDRSLGFSHSLCQ